MEIRNPQRPLLVRLARLPQEHWSRFEEAIDGDEHAGKWHSEDASEAAAMLSGALATMCGGSRRDRAANHRRANFTDPLIERLAAGRRNKGRRKLE